MAEEQDLLELPALGRPFRLGTWYNANKNQIVPAISHWKDEDTHARAHECPNITHNTDRTSEDSLKSKMDSLGIRGNFIISALANTLEVKGSGEYLNDNTTSKTQARVVLKARGTTKDVFLSMQHFSKDQVELHGEYIEKMGATHVVFGITYGYQFILILETSCESEEQKRKIEGNIERKIVGVGGGGKRPHETREEKKLDELKVRIHGTVQIPSNPISFEEAIRIYETLPELVRDKECPMTVYLLPLASISSSRITVCSQINGVVLNSVTAMFEDIINSEVALSGIQTSDIATREPRIRRKAKKLSTMLKRHKIWLQMKLQHIMSNPKAKPKQIKSIYPNKPPVVVNDSRTEKEPSESDKIQEVLKKHENSPFSAKVLGIYVSEMEKEVRFMKKLVRMLTGEGNEITVEILSDKTDFGIPFDRSKVVVLEIPIIREEDDLLEEMQNYDPDNDNGSAPCNAELLTFPFENEKIQKKTLECAMDFVQLVYSCINDRDKSQAKFKCVFKGYERDREPTIIPYNALTGDIEPSSLPN